MKTSRRCIALSLALAGLLAAAVLPAQTVQVSGSNRTIDITATDKVIAMADVATVHIGFVAYGADKDAAYAHGSAVSNGIVKALEAAGVAADRIESENQNVSPVQPYETQQMPEAERAQRHFQVTQSWTVRSTADDAAKVLDVAVKAGANQSGQIDWSLRDENAVDAQAAGKALEHARATASRMAASLGAKLGALLYASNQIEASPVRPVMRSANIVVLKQDSAPPPLSINPRRIERSATVHAIFALE